MSDMQERHGFAGHLRPLTRAALVVAVLLIVGGVITAAGLSEVQMKNPDLLQQSMHRIDLQL